MQAGSHLQTCADAMINTLPGLVRSVHSPAGSTDLAMLAALEGLPSEPEPEGPTMMGRLARELLLSGQGAAGLQQFKVGRRAGHTPPELWTRTRL
jgi:hypothetical protein